jgi:hypothetical protein
LYVTVEAHCVLAAGRHVGNTTVVLSAATALKAACTSVLEHDAALMIGFVALKAIPATTVELFCWLENRGVWRVVEVVFRIASLAAWPL